MTILLAAVLMAGTLGTAPPQESATKETKETKEVKDGLQSLPPAVREAVKTQSRGATLRGVAREVQNGETFYEVETTVKGRTRDLMLDAQGKVVSVEEQTTLSEIPEAARAAILKAVGAGKLVLVEKVTKGETTFYEGHISLGRSASEVKVDAGGHPLKP
jgi:uncharacterized membrane protein YkoI